jgi:hypothetical protein
MPGSGGRYAVRAPLIGIAAIAVFGLAATLTVPGAQHAWDHHEARIDAANQARANVLARQVRLPASYIETTALGGEPCVSTTQPGNLHCYLTPRTPVQTGPTLINALRNAGLRPGAFSCLSAPGPALGAAGSATQACSARAKIGRVEVVLAAVPNIHFGKLVRPTLGQQFVPPTRTVHGTEIILSVF